jgi:single-strand DNA-binding protein
VGYELHIIVGNLGHDAENKKTPTGKSVTTLRVAVNRSFKDARGEWQKKTEWFRVVAWGDLADRAANLKKGNEVLVEGRTETRKWTDKDTGVERETKETIASKIVSLEKREKSGSAFPPHPADQEDEFDGDSAGDGLAAAEPVAGAAGGGTGDDLDDLPF